MPANGTFGNTFNFTLSGTQVSNFKTFPLTPLVAPIGKPVTSFVIAAINSLTQGKYTLVWTKTGDSFYGAINPFEVRVQ
jgi:hypothetical protein